MFKRFGISFKLTSLVLGGVVGFVVLAAFGLSFLRSTMIEARVDKVKTLAEVARDIAQEFHQRAQAGEFDQATAQDLAKKSIRGLRYSGSEYFFIYTGDGTCVLMPPKPDLEGKNLIGLKDANGVFQIRELIEAGHHNGRPVFWQWPRPGSDKPADKVGTALSFDPWGWSIGTAIYIDDVDAEFFSVARQYAGIIGPITLLLIAGGGLLARNIARPLWRLAMVTDRLARHDFSVEIDGTERRDEVGDISRAVQVFKDNAIRIDRMTEEHEVVKVRSEQDKRQAMSDLADKFESSIRSVVRSVSSAAVKMRGTAQSLSAVAEQTSQQAVVVGVTAGEASANVQTVASSAAELSSSICEISRQVNASAGISSDAVAQAAQTNEIVNGLASSADLIGSVVQLINDIAQQTNLLALNATIEAARAG